MGNGKWGRGGNVGRGSRDMHAAYVPGNPNGGGGKPCAPTGGPPCGASMGFAPAWPSAA